MLHSTVTYCKGSVRTFSRVHGHKYMIIVLCREQYTCNQMKYKIYQLLQLEVLSGVNVHYSCT